jgi:uncharacterized membrane protein
VSPKVRLYLAWALLILSLIGWPISMLTFARDEPPVVLSLSWFAITLTCWDVVSTASVRVKQEDEGGDGGDAVGGSGDAGVDSG